jgi:hypothetical protein
MVGGSLRVLPAYSTTNAGRHDKADMLLKVELNTKNQLICYGGCQVFLCWGVVFFPLSAIFLLNCSIFFYELRIKNYNIFGVINRMNVQMVVLLIT